MSASSTPHLPVLSWLPQDKPVRSKWELPDPQYFGRRDIALLLRLCQWMCSFPPLPGRIRLEPRCPKCPWAMGRGCTGSPEQRTILLEALLLRIVCIQQHLMKLFCSSQFPYHFPCLLLGLRSSRDCLHYLPALSTGMSTHMLHFQCSATGFLFCFSSEQNNISVRTYNICCKYYNLSENIPLL